MLHVRSRIRLGLLVVSPALLALACLDRADDEGPAGPTTGTGAAYPTGGTAGTGATNTGGGPLGGTGGGQLGGTGGGQLGGTGGGLPPAGGTGGVVDPPTGGTGNDTGTGGGPTVTPGTDCNLGTNYTLGDFRLLNNQWGTTANSIPTQQCIFVNDDGSVGWSWDRTSEDPNAEPHPPPNYPEIEFGINPWGLARDPWELNTSSTLAMPIQMRDVQTANMTFSVSVNISADVGWNLAFEMWLTNCDPRTCFNEGDPSSIVDLEAMAFFGWNNGYWPLTPDDLGARDVMNDGYNSYHLYWDTPNTMPGWHYHQLRVANGPWDRNQVMSGTINIKAYVDYLIGLGWSQDLWISRFELGNEVYAGASGSTTVHALSVELNGQTYTAVPAL